MKRLDQVLPHDTLLMLWIAVLGADRVNLFEGAPFILTPFLALTPVVIASELIRHFGRGSRVEISRQAIGYASVAAALAAFVLSSVLVSPAPSASAARAMLLLATIGGTLAVVVLASDRANITALLARGAVVAIGLHAIASLAQVAALLGVVGRKIAVGAASLHLETNPYGIIPRLSGLDGDPNRTGLVLLTMVFFVAAGEPNRVVRRIAIAVAIVLMLFTLSRSTLLAVLVTLTLHIAMRRRLRIHAGTFAVGGVIVAAIFAFMLVQPPAFAPKLQPIAPLAERFSGNESSTSEHLLLLRRGLEEATASTPRLMLGIGYGAGYTVLQDVFPGNRYGNFHSLYVTMLAESGLFALLLTLALLIWPLVRGSPYVPLLAGAAVFNLFYQASTEPAFWLVVALAWTVTGLREPSERRSH